MSSAPEEPRIAHDVSKGIDRLLAAAEDLPSPSTLPDAVTRSDGSHHQDLFERYLSDLTWAADLAIPWWNAIVERRVMTGESEPEALRASYMLRPAGPASRPELVWVVRTFWLACDDLNRSLAFESRVPPQDFLLRWLQRPAHTRLLAVLSGMPYWPVGIDENGSFC